jgi:hypothetical protein
VSIASSVFAVPSSQNNITGMWVWNFSTAVSTLSQRNKLINFAISNKINLLYVNTGGVLPDHPKEFSDLIKRAHMNGIQVYALDGDSSWALTNNHAFALNRIQEVLDFNKNHNSTKFDGIQHDIEPYLLSEWTTDQNGTAGQLLQLLQDTEAKIKNYSTGMQYTMTVPFWYDEAPIVTTYNGLTKPLDYLILDIVDSIAVMDYRNSAGNTNTNLDGQIDHGKQEVEYAASVGKKAIIAAETSVPDGSGIPAYITYYNNGKTYMNNELQKVASYFGSSPGFGGIGIHHYDTYVKMSN